jgi:phosphatidate cytidylyltransferase
MSDRASPPAFGPTLARWVIGGAISLLLAATAWLSMDGTEWWRGLLAFVLVLVFGALAYLEARALLARCLDLPKIQWALSSSLMANGLLWAAAVWLPQQFSFLLWILAILWTLQALVGPRERAAQRLGLESTLLIWITIPLSAALSVWVHHPMGPLWVLWLAFVAKGADMAAYIVGSHWGKHPFFPSISPKKTQEGFQAAMLFGTLLGGLLAAAFGLGHFGLGAGLGLLFSILGACGDLGESLLKRQADRKDSGFLPGIGGVLDILDALLPAFPLLWLILQARG